MRNKLEEIIFEEIMAKTFPKLIRYQSSPRFKRSSANSKQD